MKMPEDRYHIWIEWSEEDNVYLALCPDITTAIHGDDPVALYAEYREIIRECVEDYFQEYGSYPPVETEPIRDGHKRPRSPFDKPKPARSEAA